MAVLYLPFAVLEALHHVATVYVLPVLLFVVVPMLIPFLAYRSLPNPQPYYMAIFEKLHSCAIANEWMRTHLVPKACNFVCSVCKKVRQFGRGASEYASNIVGAMYNHFFNNEKEEAALPEQQHDAVLALTYTSLGTENNRRRVQAQGRVLQERQRQSNAASNAAPAGPTSRVTASMSDSAEVPKEKTAKVVEHQEKPAEVVEHQDKPEDAAAKDAAAKDAAAENAAAPSPVESPPATRTRSARDKRARDDTEDTRDGNKAKKTKPKKARVVPATT